MNDWIANYMYKDLLDYYTTYPEDLEKFFKIVRKLTEELRQRNPQLTQTAFYYMKEIDAYYQKA